MKQRRDSLRLFGIDMEYSFFVAKASLRFVIKYDRSHNWEYLVANIEIKSTDQRLVPILIMKALNISKKN